MQSTLDLILSEAASEESSRGLFWPEIMLLVVAEGHVNA